MQNITNVEIVIVIPTCVSAAQEYTPSYFVYLRLSWEGQYRLEGQTDTHVLTILTISHEPLFCSHALINLHCAHNYQYVAVTWSMALSK